MKKLYSMFLTVALIAGIASVKAQNHCTLTDNKTFMSETQVSDNQTVKKVNDHKIITTTMPKRNLVLTEGRAVYTLTIAPEGEWEEIIINNDDGFVDYFYRDDTDTIYQREVSEGFYDIVISGSIEEGDPEHVILAYDQFEVSGNMTFSPSMSEATNHIHFDINDENGIPICELPVASDHCDILMDFIMSHASWHLQYWCFADSDLQYSLRFNNIGNRSTIYSSIRFATIDQKVYGIELPTITEGLTGDTTLSNYSDELIVHEEYFNINNPDSAYYDCAFFRFGPSPEAYSRLVEWDQACRYNPLEPLKVITNVTNNDEPIVEGSTHMKREIAPMVWESFDTVASADPTYWDRGFYDAIAPFAMALSSEGQMIREPYDFFLNRFGGVKPAYFPDFLGSFTPATYIYEPTKNLVFGYRTPLLFHQPINYNAQTSPWGASFFGGFCGYLGEGGVQRMKDEDRILKITYNGETFFEDNLYIANAGFNYVDAGSVIYDIVNDNLEVNGITKTNIAHIEFDTKRDDAQPPTLNLLQVMDANNEEIITIGDLEHSRINFAGGDYHIGIETGLWNMVYEGEVIIEAYYKTENSEYQPLEFEEKPEMFHINYGNYYEIPLSQLVGEVLNQWVTVKFVLSDMAGNSQTQELYNLFYVDDQTSISENHGLPHVVYPNPFSGEVKITAAEGVNGMANIAVYNVLGEQVYSKTENCAETKEFTINGSAWKAGVYFYSISTENSMLQGKIIKE